MGLTLYIHRNQKKKKIIKIFFQLSFILFILFLLFLFYFMKHFNKMQGKFSFILFISLVSTMVNGDTYLHNMRGSNNRLDEANRDRNNANRLFDSQNNDRGGYNVGSLFYYVGSVVTLEWTNQHGGGANGKTHSDLIIQYMCDSRIRDGT